MLKIVLLGSILPEANKQSLVRGTWGLSVDLQEIPQGTGSGFLWDKEMNCPSQSAAESHTRQYIYFWYIEKHSLF